MKGAIKLRQFLKMLLPPVFLLLFCINSHPESFDANIEINAGNPAGNSVLIGINSPVLLTIGSETHFLKGIEIEINAPQSWLAHHGSLAMAMYNNINLQTISEIANIDGSLVAFETLPSRLRIIYHLPICQPHGLRTTTSITVSDNIAPPSTFPVLFRLMPVIKGLSGELEEMTFNLTAKPIFSDEGAVKLIAQYPDRLINRPFTVLIDNNVVGSIEEQIVLQEGEHHLVILSDDYRNESRRFIIERSKTLDLIIDLQDPTPILIFEGPQNALIYLNNTQILNTGEPVTVEPGSHEVKFQVGDYTLIQIMTIQRGKTYRVALNVDIVIHEED